MVGGCATWRVAWRGGGSINKTRLDNAFSALLHQPGRRHKTCGEEVPIRDERKVEVAVFSWEFDKSAKKCPQTDNPSGDR